MSEPLLCTAAFISAAPDSCAYVQAACNNQYTYLNFLEFYYCTLDQNVPIIVILSVLFVLFIFNLLSTTADKYLAPSLEVLAQKLEISEAIAGVTLLALANGATDVVAGLVAGGKDDGGVQIAIGALFGACLFTVTCVLARCIQGGGKIETDHKTVSRDQLFLLIATVYFIFLAVIDKVTPMLAVGFFLIYALYFCYVIYQERRSQAPKIAVKEQLVEINEDARRRNSINKSLTMGDSSVNIDEIAPYVTRKSIKKILSRKSLSEGRSFYSYDQLVEDEKGSHKHSGHGHADMHKDEVVILDANRVEPEEDEDDNSLFGRFMRIYNTPFIFIRDLTMPPFEEERWNRYIASLTPFFGLLFLIWQFGLLEDFIRNSVLWIVYAVITLPLAIWIFITGKDSNITNENSGKFSFVNFVISAIWLSIFVNCFLDFLSLITVISGLPLNYLSLTLIAWGNSLDDFFIDYFIAKSGHGAMAVTGVYSGQLFNLLIGFGGSMFLQSLRGTVRPGVFIFTEETMGTNILTLVLLGSLIFCLVGTYLVCKINRWAMSKKTMAFLLTYYTSFFIVVTVISIVI